MLVAQVPSSLPRRPALVALQAVPLAGPLVRLPVVPPRLLALAQARVLTQVLQVSPALKRAVAERSRPTLSLLLAAIPPLDLRTPTAVMETATTPPLLWVSVPR